MKPGAGVAIGIGLLAAGCGSTNISLDRDYGTPAEAAVEYDAQSPDAFTERLGDPDEWRNEGKGSDLRMIAVWKCRDGKDREVVWRQADAGKGVGRWVVVSDTTRDGDCD